MASKRTGPIDREEIGRFIETFFYAPEAFLVDEVVSLDPVERAIVARLDTRRALPVTRHQRVTEAHPAHVSGADLIMVTGCLGCMHAWFFHGCRWDEGWVGFGNKIHSGEFRSLASPGPVLELRSRETRARIGARRIVIRFEFEFSQRGDAVYRGDQSAMFVKR